MSGDDAVPLLDGLITNAIHRIDQGGAIHAGLLSPKGKILFDFFIVRDGADLLIETASHQVGELIKRLTFYRLRAQVSFEDVSSQFVVVANWGGDVTTPETAVSFVDPRNAELGQRILWPAGQRAQLDGIAEDAGIYATHRIGLAMPEAGADYELGEAFPHEAMYDLLGSVDFAKGCFVGQEVVSRMHHLGTPRNRIVMVRGDAALAPGGDIVAGDTKIGTVGSVDGSLGLALVRLDRAHAADTAGTELTAGDGRAELIRPEWAALDMTTGAAQSEP